MGRPVARYDPAGLARRAAKAVCGQGIPVHGVSGRVSPSRLGQRSHHHAKLAASFCARSGRLGARAGRGRGLPACGQTSSDARRGLVYLRVDKPLRASLVPFAVFSVLMIAAVFRVNADAPRYSLPFMPALDVFAAAVVAGLLGARKRAAVTVGVLCCGLFLTRALWLHTRPLGEATEARAILAWVAQNRLADKTLLIPQDYVPTVHYYFPRTTLTGYRDVASFADERLHGHFAAIYPAQP